MPTIPANTPVTLNQYNIKAYPDHLFEASAYGDGAGDIAYESKVKVLGMQRYVGPVVKYDPSKTSKITVGARITTMRMSYPIDTQSNYYNYKNPYF